MAADLDIALTRVGANLAASTDPDLRAFRRDEVSRLADAFEDARAARRLAGLTREVLEQLHSPEASKAAWDDLLTALDEGASTVSACALAMDQLNELMSGRGHELWAQHSLMGAAARSGDMTQARNLVAERPKDDATVAWLVFVNADLDRDVLSVGPVRFFTGRIPLKELGKLCNAGADPYFPPAPELTDDFISAYLGGVDSEHVVWARVDLTAQTAEFAGSVRRVPPLVWARRVVSDLVDAAGFRHGGTGWILLEGGSYVTARGTDGGTLGFMNPDDTATLRARHPRSIPAVEWLEELPAGYVSALAAGAPEARSASDAVSWHREVSMLANPSMRLALQVRRFEVQWSTGDGGRWRTWEDPLRHYMRDHWSRHEQSNALYWVGYRLHGDRRTADPRSRVCDAAVRVRTDNGNGRFVIGLREVIEWAPLAAGGFSGGSMQRRMLREVARQTRDGASAQRWWRELRRDFDALLNRAVRQRNRIIHGREPVHAVIETVEKFVADRSATLAAQAVVGAAAGRSVESFLEEERQDLSDLYDSLPGETSAQALFDLA